MSSNLKAARIPKRLSDKIEKLSEDTGLTESELLRFGLHLVSRLKSKDLIKAVIESRKQEAAA